jgi:predicted DNA-binding protein
LTSQNYEFILSIMLPKATTFRLEPTLQAGLENLSKILRRPMNQLVNEALRDYVSRRNRAAEQDLKATLDTLRAYRLRDPNFKEAIAATAKAEAQYADSDPVEGHVVIGELVEGHLAEEAGPVLTEIHQLLHG